RRRPAESRRSSAARPGRDGGRPPQAAGKRSRAGGGYRISWISAVAGSAEIGAVDEVRQSPDRDCHRFQELRRDVLRLLDCELAVEPQRLAPDRVDVGGGVTAGEERDLRLHFRQLEEDRAWEIGRA